MTTEQILHLTAHPEQLNRDTLFELRNLLNRYPAFHAARVLYLRNLYQLGDSEFHPELRRTSISLSDRKFLFSRTVGMRMNVSAPAPSYEAHGTQIEATPRRVDRTLSLIDGFLHNQQIADDLPEILRTDKPNVVDDTAAPLDTSTFTETLAKVYIKQKRYNRALEIMEALYKQHPKRSAYFADQIKIIKELMQQGENPE